MITAVVRVTGVWGQRSEVRAGGLEVVDDSADGLDVGVLGLPLVMAAVVSTLHDVHAATEVWLLVHHPAEDGGDMWSDSHTTHTTSSSTDLLLLWSVWTVTRPRHKHKMCSVYCHHRLRINVCVC